jgi:CDGSH-type Zn-finger protein
MKAPVSAEGDILDGNRASDRQAYTRPISTPRPATVTVYPDGPLILRGDFVIRELDGTVVQTGRVVALCRCGRSALKPLCDGSHKNATRRPAPSVRDAADD